MIFVKFTHKEELICDFLSATISRSRRKQERSIARGKLKQQSCWQKGIDINLKLECTKDGKV